MIRPGLLSSTRLRFGATLLVVLLVIATSAMTIGMVSRIFSRLTPIMRTEIEWKARGTADLLADRSQLGVLLNDTALVQKSADEVLKRGDVIRVVASDASGDFRVDLGTKDPSMDDPFVGAPGVLRWGREHVSTWSESAVEGRVVSRVAVYVSTAQLAAGEQLRRDIILITLVAGAAGLGASLWFVSKRLVPLIHVTETALRDVEAAAVGLAAKERLEKELEIGAKIQATILPPTCVTPGAEIAAEMRPATEVGGDYYDVLPAKDGCWIGIGDVAGHGVTAGLIMLMVQSTVSALTRLRGELMPSELLPALNAVLHDNIRNRLKLTEYVTFSLLRYFRSGEVQVAGAHEDIIVYRAALRRCDRIQTTGTWLGAVRDISASSTTKTLHLAQGDVMVLYTDGITEAMNPEGQMYGLDRLCAAVERHGKSSATDIRDALFSELERWSAERADDQSLVVVRQTEMGSL